MNRTRLLTLTVCALTVMPALAQAQAKPKPTKKPPKVEEAAPVAPVKKTLAETLTGSAKTDYDAGITLYKQGQFGPASAKFVQAYSTSNDARLLWNAAAAEKQERNYAKARDYVRQYVQLSPDLAAKEKDDATELLATLDRLVSEVTITVNEAGASVAVDNEVVGESPLAKAVSLSSGEHLLKVSKTGFLPYQSTFKVAGGGAQAVNVALAPHIKEGRIAVRASEADATILVDRQIVGKGSYAGLVGSGAHELGVTREGFKPYSLNFTIAENGTRSFDVSLERAKRRVPVAAIIAGSVLLVGITTAVIIIATSGDSQQQLEPGTFPPGKVSLASF